MRRALPAFALVAFAIALSVRPVAAADPETVAADEQVLKDAKLPTDGPALLDFFRKRTSPDVGRARIEILVRELADSDAKRRDQAAADLVALGYPAVPLLRQAAKDLDDVETVGRARKCLQLIEGDAAAALSGAAVRLLAVRHPPGTAAVLLAYVPFAEDDTVVEEVENTLIAVLSSSADPDPAVLAALVDPVPVRRAVAADALCHSGHPAALPKVRALLHDPKPTVRLRVALALADRREGDAIPVLIDALADAPIKSALHAQDYLRDLAGPIGPDRTAAEVVEGNAVARQACRAAWAAWWRKHDGATLLGLLRKGTPSDADRDKVAALIGQLGDDDFEVRTRASQELQRLGERAVPQLRLALHSPDAEVVRRADACLRKIGSTAPANSLIALARLIALRKPDGAAQALLGYLPYVDDAAAVEECQKALDRVAVNDGRIDAAVIGALADPLAVRRAAAGVALAHAGPAHRQAVRKLLADRDPTVRLRVALALVEARDREAIKPLIMVLGDLPPERLDQAEDVLRSLAGDHAPDVTSGKDAASRVHCRDAWLAWWDKHGAAVDLARLDAAPGTLGLTVICQMSTRGGFEVLEVGRDQKVRWRITGVQNASDAQVLPGRRVLLAEYQGQRVTERNFKGDVLWEHRVPQNPITAQRLPNGHTFIATQFQLLEIDRAGKEVFTYRTHMPFMAAAKGRDGTMVGLTQQGTLLRLDAKGKQLKSVTIGYTGTLGGIHLLPRGNVLVPDYRQNKVIEYDADGKAVWEAAVRMPTSAQRLSNGHTLVASQNLGMVVELDRGGKTVWEYKADGRPWRARGR
jgi:HEAT repeat protein